MIVSPIVYASMFADTLSATAPALTPPMISADYSSWWGPLGVLANVLVTLFIYAVNGLVTFFQVMFVLPLYSGVWILTIINSLFMGITIFLVLDFVHGLV